MSTNSNVLPPKIFVDTMSLFNNYSFSVDLSIDSQVIEEQLVSFQHDDRSTHQLLLHPFVEELGVIELGDSRQPSSPPSSTPSPAASLTLPDSPFVPQLHSTSVGMEEDTATATDTKDVR